MSLEQAFAISPNSSFYSFFPLKTVTIENVTSSNPRLEIFIFQRIKLGNAKKKKIKKIKKPDINVAKLNKIS